MYLKRIEIQGFKSFAEKIGMDFERGVTCIVGPNGSGKSNISDCIRWVLGEQSAKSLRGGKMEDVIFAGTENRKSMGFARVSIILDNQDESLPIDYSEVIITRRLYRSGESEFLINNNQCRLKDIHELLMDTGIGKDGYSIIGQGRVDEILSTKSEDRRAVFEEAAGIVKYKTRKNESLKKLKETSDNIERINDTVEVLKGQLDPLEKQSIKAKKYLELSEELKEAEVLSYIDRIGKAYEQKKQIEVEYEESLSLVTKQEMELKKEEDTYNSENQKLQEIDKRLEETKNIFYKSEGKLSEFAYQIKVDEEKINSASLNIFRLKDEVRKLNDEVLDKEKDQKSKKDKLKKMKEKESETEKKLEDEEKKLNNVLDNLNDKQNEMERLNNSYLEKLNEKTITTNCISNAENLLQSIKEKKQELEKELNQDKDKVSFFNKDLEAVCNKIKNSQDLLIKESDRAKEIELLVKDLEKKYEDNTKLLNDTVVNINSNISKSKILKDLEDNFEGYTRSVKNVLKLIEKNDKFKKGVYGVLLKLITVPKELETAIEVALGNALQYIVTDTENEAKNIIEYLKKNNLGRATFLPISSVEGREFEKDLMNKIESTKGFVGFGSKVISYDYKYYNIILSFLGKVVIVSDLQSGIEMAKKFKHKFKIVTKKGEFLTVGGAITGGSLNKETGILARGRQIEELEKIILDNKQKEKELRNELENIDMDLSNKKQELLRCRKDQKDYEIALLKDMSLKERIEDDMKNHKSNLEKKIKEKEDILEEENETKEKYENDKRRLCELEKEMEDIQIGVSKNKEKHKSKLRERENLQGRVMQMKIDLNKVIDSIQSVSNFIQMDDDNINRLKTDIAKKTKEREEYQNTTEALNKDIEMLRKKLEDESKNKDGMSQKIQEIEKEKEDKAKYIEKSFLNLSNINKNIVVLKEEFTRVSNKKEKVEDDINCLKDRLWEDYELTYQNAISLNKDSSKKVSMKRINDLKTSIKDLGDVNVLAIEEYKKVKEHYEFMINQKSDMEKSVQNLKKVISEITQVMKEQFITQFKIINENFNVVFNELFEGGRAKLVLEDENNVLESGIQIQVQPPGKKLQNMMLLSGGERAFTAIALLFAIIKLRPAPFCILDEIEAALDDANVYKFAEYIRRHVDFSQFILITHRKGTMESADTIYGVTMKEKGVSKIVSLKLDQLKVRK